MCLFNWPDSQLSINQYDFIIFSSLSGQSSILAIAVAYSSVGDKLCHRTSHLDAQGWVFSLQNSKIFLNSVALSCGVLTFIFSVSSQFD